MKSRLASAKPALLLGLALLGCGAPPSSGKKSEVVNEPKTPLAVAAPVPADKPPPEAAGPTSSCPFGLEALARIDVTPGAPAYFYEDRTSFARTNGDELAYVYLDHESNEVRVARLGADGAKKSVRTVRFKDKHERAHVVGAPHGKSITVAATVYHAPKEADIELTKLDAEDHVVWSKRIDPSPLFDDAPAVAWTDEGIALAWTRGTYPSANRVMFALVDPETGNIRDKREIANSVTPGSPVVVGDGGSFWVAYQSNTLRGGIQVVKVPRSGDPEMFGLDRGANPSILPTPAGLALAFDDQRAIWFSLLDGSGKPKVPPTAVLQHPDPIATPRKPVLAWDGARFGIAYEVHFSASVMIAHAPEARFAVVDPNGVASPSVRLHAEEEAGEMPAALFTGKEWLAVFNRNRLQPGKTAQVTSTRLVCSAAEKPEMAAGPCDAHEADAPEALRWKPSEVMAAAVRKEDGGIAAVAIERATEKPKFVQLGKTGQPIGAPLDLAVNPKPRYPVMARRPGQTAVGMITSSGDVDVMLFNDSGSQNAFSRMFGDKTTYTPGLAYTPKGLVVAYGRGGNVVTEVIAKDYTRPRQPEVVAKPAFVPGDCALGYGPRGLLLAFSTGTNTSETNVIHVLRLDDDGLPLGDETIATDPHGFLRSPAVLGTPNGFLLLGTGPFSREVVGIEVGPNGEVKSPERKLLSSYGYATFGAYLQGNDAHVFGLDGKKLQDRLVCP